MPGSPGKLRPAVIEDCLHPWSVVDLHLDRSDGRRSPCHPVDLITPIAQRYFGGRRFQQHAAHGCLRHDGHAVVVLLADRDVITTHEASQEARIAHLDTAEPFDVGHAIPTWYQQTHRETVG